MNFKHESVILTTDSYKSTHLKQYPPNTHGLFCYGEARNTTGKNDMPNYTVFFGMQAIIDRYLSTPITREDIDKAELLHKLHGVPFYREPWDAVVQDWRGLIPVRIHAAPEGMPIPNGNVLWTVQSLDGRFPHFASFIETLLLRVWYPCTVATISHQAKSVIRDFMLKTCDNLDGLPFKLHDFGARGVSSGESAGLGCMAHLLNFYGTDTFEGILAAQQHYHESCAGFSIPAMEHSTVTSWGRDGEVSAYENMLANFGKPGAIFAAVSDSYDIDNAVENLWGGELRQKVIDSGATLVIRPDSGDPRLVLPRLLQKAADKFGFDINSKGYRVLRHVRFIWGDGIDHPGVIHSILNWITEQGWSADNVAFGMGGGLLQKVNRDSLGFAYKTSAAFIDGEWRDVYKDPITDQGKRSKRGRLTLVKRGDEILTMNATEGHSWSDNTRPLLQLVYSPGLLLPRTNLTTARANTGLW